MSLNTENTNLLVVLEENIQIIFTDSVEAPTNLISMAPMQAQGEHAT